MKSNTPDPADPSRLATEAAAFDSQIRERIAHGYVPDLRRARACDYFYNNPWRRPEYVALDFGQILQRVVDAVKCYGRASRTPRVLEVGCGPGYMSLELARNGFDVTGVDIALDAVSVAREYADQDPWKQERGPLRYLVGNFLDARGSDLRPGSFDVVLFVGALHHFPEQDRVGARVAQLLDSGGIVIAHEPTRDRITTGLAQFVALVRVLLAAGGGFFEDVPLPATDVERDAQVRALYHFLRCEDGDTRKTQSVNDNEAGYGTMHAMLDGRFDTLLEYDTSAFFHELIGGLRFTEEKNAALARYIRDADGALVRSGVLPATEFFYVGRRRDR